MLEKKITLWNTLKNSDVYYFKPKESGNCRNIREEILTFRAKALRRKPPYFHTQVSPLPWVYTDFYTSFNNDNEVFWLTPEEGGHFGPERRKRQYILCRTRLSLVFLLGVFPVEMKLFTLPGKNIDFSQSTWTFTNCYFIIIITD